MEKGVGAFRILKIKSYLNHARRQIDQVDRRPRREDPAGREGVFDLRGALVREGQVPVELGVPVAVLEDRHGLLLHHRILWKGSDHAVPMIREAQARFPDLCSFDRGFHSPRIALDELLDALPKKGKLGGPGTGS